MQKVKDFLDFVIVYPLSNMGHLKEKEERAIVPVLEKLYRFNGWGENNPNTIAEFKAAYREFDVTLKLSKSFPVKVEYFTKITEDLQKKAVECFNQVADVMKQNQKLNQYLKTANVKASDLKSECSKFMFDLNKQHH